jgi:hypothetical protein
MPAIIVGAPWLMAPGGGPIGGAPPEGGPGGGSGDPPTPAIIVRCSCGAGALGGGAIGGGAPICGGGGPGIGPGAAGGGPPMGAPAGGAPAGLFCMYFARSVAYPIIVFWTGLAAAGCPCLAPQKTQWIAVSGISLVQLVHFFTEAPRLPIGSIGHFEVARIIARMGADVSMRPARQ